MRLGVISDTHDNIPATRAAADVFAEQAVDQIIHCGDFIAPPTLEHLDRGIPIHGVRGNNDGELEGLQSAFANLTDGTFYGRFADLRFDGTTVAVHHGEYPALIDAIASGDHYDYVCYGHWHTTEERSVGDTTVLNPGALYAGAEPSEQTVAIIDTETDSIEFKAVSWTE